MHLFENTQTFEAIARVQTRTIPMTVVFHPISDPGDDEPQGRLIGPETLEIGAPVQLALEDGRRALVVIVGDDNRFRGTSAFW